MEERSYWVKTIEDINTRLPKDFVWITSFDAKNPVVKADAADANAAGGGKGKNSAPSGPVLLLKGLWLFNERGPLVFDDFVNKLKESPLYDVITDKDKGFVRSVENDSEWAYEFAIPLVLKNSITLPASRK